MNVIGIYGLIHFPRQNDLSSLPLFILAFMWVEFWNNVATAPFSALIPDVVPLNQRGSASGWYGLMSMLGSFAGGGSALIFTRNGGNDIVLIFFFFAGAFLFGMLWAVFFLKETKGTRQLAPICVGEILSRA